MNEGKNNTIKLFYSLGITLLVFLSSLFVFSILTLFSKQNITALNFWVSILVSFCVSAYISIKKIKLSYLQLFFVFIASIIIFIGFTAVSRSYIDLTYDGQSYHQAGIIALDKGWNPIHENIFDVKEINSQMKIWIDSYPHASNLQAFNLYKVTGNIEDGKVFNLVLVLTAFLFSWVAIKEITKNSFVTWIIAIIVQLSAVNLMQWLTFGLDSQFYCLFVILASSLILIHKKTFGWIDYIPAGLSILLLVNTKLVNVVYACMIIIVYLGYLAIFEKKWKPLFKQAGVFLIIGLISFFVFGFQPFVTNTLKNGNPFYPVISTKDGVKQYDYTENRPSNYANTPTIILFPSSIFFKSNGSFRPPEDKAEFKIPFTYTQNEVNQFIYLGPKSGGFGVLFSGIFILCILAIILILATSKDTKLKSNLLYLIIALFVITIVNSLSSSARYAPQFWLFIPIVATASIMAKKRPLYILTGIIFFVVIANSYIIFNRTSDFNNKGTKNIKNRLTSLADYSKNRTIIVNYGPFDGNEYLLNYYGVKYERDTTKSFDKFNCPQGFTKEKLFTVGNSAAMICKE